MLARLTLVVKWAVVLAISVVILLFALNNHAPVAISLLPLPFEIEAPFFLFIMLAFLGGLLIGGIMVSAQAIRWKRKFIRESRKSDALSAEASARQAKHQGGPALTASAA